MVKGKEIDKYWKNEVLVCGRFHRVSGVDRGKHSGADYVKFSVLTETLDVKSGYLRPNHVVCRAYDPDIRAFVGGLMEGDEVALGGEIISSTGSGGLFVLVREIEIKKDGKNRVV